MRKKYSRKELPKFIRKLSVGQVTALKFYKHVVRYYNAGGDIHKIRYRTNVLDLNKKV